MSGKSRRETDALGAATVPGDRLWGTRTNMNMNEVIANIANGPP
jgi:fumarate hydratase class II